ncbi:MAG TPA: PIG-L deacetylase family protein [Candidatus Saccharimonadales bacterium]|nr:PIG-L deacetylase family protein [Candidatus Saccharimonadales bacterium]
MKKIIFALFAHPDDESFGPSGTLLLESRAGTDVHLMTLTSGDSGMNPDNHNDLGAVRLKEWQTAGKLMGAQSMQYLGYKDGQLNNHTMIEASQRVINLITPIIAAAPDDAQIEIMTNDLNGITGHIDHIVAARIACFVFYTMKAYDVRFQRIRLACLARTVAPNMDVSWLYMEPGRTDDEINEVIDARQVRDEIIAIIRAHHTQRGDGETHIKQLGEQLGLNYFIIKQ